jgi:4-amino-4-deoxy-L-arabinose transferase-like glycosyltransferase
MTGDRSLRDSFYHSSESPPPSFLVEQRMFLLAALGLVLYVGCIGLFDLWYPDEPDIAEVAQAMFVSGDWIAPRRMGVIWVDYPPLVYWAGSLSSALLGGMNQFTLRLPSALAAIGLVLLTCAVASRWYDGKTGLWAGFLLLTFSQFVLEAVGYRTDMLFSFFIGAGLLVYASGVGDRMRWWPRVAGFALLGLAMLTKGPLGLLLPGLVLTLWHGARREWRALLQLAPLSLISLAIYIPWFVACAKEMGSDNMLYELWAQNFQRFVSGERTHKRPFYYYLVAIWYDLAPWTLLLPFALWWIHRNRLWQNRHTQLAIWWFAAFFVFLSIAITKRQMYLLPAYPAIALLMAPWIRKVTRAGADLSSPDSRLARVSVAFYAIVLVLVGAVCLISAVSTGFIMARLNLEALYKNIVLAMRFPSVVLGVVSLSAGFWVARAWRRGDIPAAFYRSAVAFFSIYLIGLAWIMPTINPAKTYAPAGRWIREQIGAEKQFGLAFPARDTAKMGAFGFYTGALVELLEKEDEIERFLRENPKSVVLLHQGSATKIYGNDRTDWRARVIHELVAGGFHYFVLRGSRSDTSQNQPSL